MCSQQGNPRTASEDVMGQGRRNVCHFNQWNAESRSRIFAHPAGHRAGRKDRSAGVCGRVPIFLRKELSAIPAQNAGALPEREQRRGAHGGKPYPFPELFYLRTYAGIVHILYVDGKCVPDFKRQIAIPMVEVWRHSQEEILRFKTMENGVLFAAGSCWEGVDFPGDMVSSLIIVKLPFAVPDPISEAEKETYDSLETYIQSIIVPDMQKKLRQGFGRAIRTETDTCVVSILDIRAVKGGKYHEDVMCALPPCRIAEELKEVQDFIRSRKGVEYYL